MFDNLTLRNSIINFYVDDLVHSLLTLFDNLLDSGTSLREAIDVCLSQNMKLFLRINQKIIICGIADDIENDCYFYRMLYHMQYCIQMFY